MLNASEGIGAQTIDKFARVLSKTIGDQGTVILIEPGTRDDKEYCRRTRL